MTPRMQQLLRDKRVGVSGRVLGLHIADIAEEDTATAWVGFIQLYNDLGISTTALQRAMSVLVARGYIQKLSRSKFRGSCGWRWIETPPETATKPRQAATMEERA